MEDRDGHGLQPRHYDVKCVEYLHRLVYCGQSHKERGNCHWLRESGRWYLIFGNPCLAL